MKFFYSWQEFDGDIKKISAWARGQNFDSVYGIPRGGLVTAVLLSHRLNLPLKLKIEELNGKTLIVDDISDSGKTLEKFGTQLSFKPVVATLFYTSTKSSGVYSLDKSRRVFAQCLRKLGSLLPSCSITKILRAFQTTTVVKKRSGSFFRGRPKAVRNTTIRVFK